MYQQTIIIGNVGLDPEMRYTPSGAAVCSFSVAVNKTWTSNGEKREKTTWFKVSAWRKLAETCNAYVRKGMLIMVSGEIDASAYMSQSGDARASLELTAHDVKFLTRSDSAGGVGYDDSDTSTDEDIPF